MTDILALVVILTAVGTVAYLIGADQGRQQGWRDSQVLIPEMSREEVKRRLQRRAYLSPRDADTPWGVG